MLSFSKHGDPWFFVREMSIFGLFLFSLEMDQLDRILRVSNFFRTFTLCLIYYVKCTTSRYIPGGKLMPLAVA